MPVEIREVVVRAELAPRQLKEMSLGKKSTRITPELIGTIKSICENEFRRLAGGKVSGSKHSGKFDR